MALSGIALCFIVGIQVLLARGGQVSYEWQSYNPAEEDVPENAIVAGYDADDSIMYVSQMRIEREKVPAQLIPEKSISYAIYKGDIYKSNLTPAATPVLCGRGFTWVQASLGDFPKNAIPCGKTESGDTLYVGRAEYKGSIIIGGVGPTRSALFAAYNGTEVQWFGVYKVLVYNDIDQWTRATFEDFPEDAVVGGYDRAGRNLYIGIIRIGAQVVPAQINPETMLATASYPGGIAESDDFQVLTGGTYQWVSVKKGKIPENVVIAGRSADGEAMYVGRVVYKKLMLPGTVLATEKVLYISYLGKLRTVESGYQLLVRGEDKLN